MCLLNVLLVSDIDANTDAIDGVANFHERRCSQFTQIKLVKAVSFL